MPTREKIANRKSDRRKTAIKVGNKTAKKQPAKVKAKNPAVIPPEKALPAPQPKLTLVEVIETEVYRTPDLVIIETEEKFGT